MINIENPADCCGCTACMSICGKHAITMKADEYGFLYPTVNIDKCTDCGLCDVTCPVKYRKVQNTYESTIKNAFAVRLKDVVDLNNSSSGGAFWGIVQYVIGKSGVVCGATYNEDMQVIHKIAYTLEESRQFQGSKYSQSNISGIYQKIKRLLNTGRLVLFSGTPCQNDGLLRYLRKQYSNLITVDIICHSIPSPRYFRDYLSRIEKNQKKVIVDIKMRDKSLGWGKDSYVYKFSDGNSVHNPSDIKCWQLIFESGYITRDSCFECQYTNKRRVTDFTIGDFWDFGKLRTDIYSEKGTSVLFVNTSKANDLFKKIKDSFYCWSIKPEEYEQPRLTTHLNRPQQYFDFKSIYVKKGFKASYDKYFAIRPSLCFRCKYLFLRLLSKLSKKNS